MNSSTLVQLFSQLVAIDSPSGEEKAISNYVAVFLKKLGLNPMLDKNNMIYCRVGQKPNPVLFCAHLDTVEPGRNIKVVQKNRLLCSDGRTILGGDNKIPLTAILWALSNHLVAGKMPNIELLFTVREETDSGIKNFDVNKIQARLGFIFDHSGGDLGLVVTSAPTIADFQIELFGQASHASLPEKGRNVLNYLLKLGASIPLGRVDQNTTFNIGIIQGGSATNTVPNYLCLAGDLRSTVEDSFSKTKKQINRLFVSQKGIKAKIDWQLYSYGYQINQADPNLQKLIAFYRQHGTSLKIITTNGGSDASYLNRNGIKTFCLGDGLINVHTVKEQIKVSNFVKLSHLIADLMLE